MLEFSQCDCLGAEPFHHVRLARQFRAQSLDGDLALEHKIDSLIHSTHSALADLFKDLVTPDDIVDHTAASASRVCLMPFSPLCPSTPIPTNATVILSYPPRSLARVISPAQAECTSPRSTPSIISLSSTRSYSPSEHSRNRSPALIGNGSSQVDISISG